MAKTIEAKVMKPKIRTSKGVKYPWQVWYVDSTTGFYEYGCGFTTEKQAKNHVKRYPEDAAVIVHINISKMKY